VKIRSHVDLRERAKRISAGNVLRLHDFLDEVRDRQLVIRHEDNYLAADRESLAVR